MKSRTVKLKSDMWPKKPIKEMWSNGPAMLKQHKMTKKSQKQVPQEDNKKSESTCSDKNCQENEIINIWLPKPAVLDKYRRLCNDKNCQSTRCYKQYEDTKYR